jgi:hypothetical protein
MTCVCVASQASVVKERSWLGIGGQRCQLVVHSLHGSSHGSLSSMDDGNGRRVQKRLGR